MALFAARCIQTLAQTGQYYGKQHPKHPSVSFFSEFVPMQQISSELHHGIQGFA